MKINNYRIKLKRYHQKLLGSTVEHDLAAYHQVVADIQARQPVLASIDDESVRALSQHLIIRAKAGESLDDLLVEAFALVNEAVWRVLHQRPFAVQIIAGITMHQGKLVEMQTGEGKTLAAVFPAFLNALGGKGVHVLTFNDYLARRDAMWMGPVYAFLGMHAAFVQEGMSAEERRKAYSADITYLTAKEAGFDHLRDTLCGSADAMVHRSWNYAIIDEADSILVDESRVPMVIAGPADYFGASERHTGPSLHDMALIVRQLQRPVHFDFDEYGRNVHLTENGTDHVEQLLGCGNLYADDNTVILIRLGHALHAEYLLHVDKDYIVRDGIVELVDEFTGRVAQGRRWPAGLHEALEAKEKLTVCSGGTVLNSITMQHLILRYPRRSGMTATAQPAEREFREQYGLHTVVIPPNRPCIRRDLPDLVFASGTARNSALCAEIAAVHTTGRPILVGTRTVDESAELAGLLTRQGVRCEVLNAKCDELEAQIIARAGKRGAVTISTNMAGRGTDIRLGGGDPQEEKAVRELGGLYVIGTNRHESRRIDQQLRGRAGRQGDPGLSRFFVSLDDDLFVKYRIKELLPSGRLFKGSDGIINNPVVNSEVNRLQRIIEGQHAQTKATLCNYSVLVERQRQVLWQKREGILHGNDALEMLSSSSPRLYGELSPRICADTLQSTCRGVALFHLDRLWSRHLGEIGALREGIHLRKYGLQDPLFEFNKMIIGMFDTLLEEYQQATVQSFQSLRVTGTVLGLSDAKVKSPSATWTYLISDNPTEDQFKLTADMGHSVFVGLMWPLALLFLVVKGVAGKRRRTITRS